MPSRDHIDRKYGYEGYYENYNDPESRGHIVSVLNYHRYPLGYRPRLTRDIAGKHGSRSVLTHSPCEGEYGTACDSRSCSRNDDTPEYSKFRHAESAPRIYEVCIYLFKSRPRISVHERKRYDRGSEYAAEPGVDDLNVEFVI